MSVISVQPVQWSSLKDIDDIEPLNERDADCFAEVREVLKRHGKLDRFGLALLHSHFPIEPGEILLESTDKKNRTLSLEPVRTQADPSKHVGTIWQLADDDAITMSWCRQYCQRGLVFGHDKAHDRVK